MLWALIAALALLSPRCSRTPESRILAGLRLRGRAAPAGVDQPAASEGRSAASRARPGADPEVARQHAALLASKGELSHQFPGDRAAVKSLPAPEPCSRERSLRQRRRSGAPGLDALAALSLQPLNPKFNLVGFGAIRVGDTIYPIRAQPYERLGLERILDVFLAACILCFHIPQARPQFRKAIVSLRVMAVPSWPANWLR